MRAARQTRESLTSSPAPRYLAVLVILFGVYFAAGKLGLSMAFVNASASPVWPPTGIALAALLLLGYRVWPAILAGAFLVNATTAGTPATALCIAAGNTLEGLLGAWLVNRYAGGRHAFDRAPNIFKFAGLAGILSTTVSASLGVTTLCALGPTHWADFGPVWLTWWLGDAVSALVVAPVFLLWRAAPRPRWQRDRAAEALLLVAVLVLGGLIVFGHLPAGIRNQPLGFAFIPLLVWAAYRFGAREAATATLLLSGIAIGGTLRGFGPFSREDPNESLLLLQSFLGVLAFTATALGAVATERRRAEQRLRRANDELELRVQARTAELSRAVSALLQEVAVRQHVEAELRGGERRLAEAQALVRMGSWNWDIPTDSVSWSDELYRIYGIEPRTHAASYESLLAGVHPDDRARIDEKLRRCHATGEPFGFDHRIVRPDGVERWLRGRGEVVLGADGRPLRMHGTAEDITERKQAEEALKGSEERFRCVAQLANEGIIVADGTGRLLWWNDAAREIFGYAEENQPGLAVSDLLPKRYRADLARGLERERSGGASRLAGKAIEVHGLRRDRTEFPLELSLTRWKSEGELFFGAIVRDITERKRAEAQIRKINAELEGRVEERTAALRRSNEDLRQFAYVASHDLKEPLRTISSYMELLKERYAGRLGADADEFIRHTVDGATRMHQLIDDLLAYSRLDDQGVSIEPTDSDWALEIALDNLQLAIRESGARITRGTLPRVTVDRTQMTQLFQNLLGNAIKFRSKDAPPGIHVDAEDRGSEWLFSVQDNGIGFDSRHAERIFVIFQRLHSRGEYAGTGIGLAFCKKIVERHGGRVWVKSRPGEGSVFYFTLPRSEDAAPLVEEREGVLASPIRVA